MFRHQVDGVSFARKNERMARGWESKSVESQIEDGKNERGGSGSKRSLQDIEAQQRREGLENSRRGVLRELESAKSPLRRAALEQALKHLDEQLKRS
jgi:hypothetical protein